MSAENFGDGGFAMADEIPAVATIERGLSADLPPIGLTGDRLRALRCREQPLSPLLGILDYEASLHLLVGPSKVSKTSFAATLSLAISQGLSPWPGAPSLPAGRVLFISGEQSATKIDDLLCRLTKSADLGHEDDWTDRIGIVARDPDLEPSDRQMLTLDDRGIATLRKALEAARSAEDPFQFVVLDSYLALKPSGVLENDSDTTGAWLRKLADLALDCEVYILLIHHMGHTKDGPARGPVSASRGTSTFGQVAQVILRLTKDPRDPRKRILSIDGNSIEPSAMTFRVSDESEPWWRVNRFEPEQDSVDDRWQEIFRPGVAMSINKIAGILASPPGSPPQLRPSGRYRRLAEQLCERHEKSRNIEKLEGNRWRLMQ